MAPIIEYDPIKEQREHLLEKIKDYLDCNVSYPKLSYRIVTKYVNGLVFEIYRVTKDMGMWFFPIPDQFGKVAQVTWKFEVNEVYFQVNSDSRDSEIFKIAYRIATQIEKKFKVSVKMKCERF